MDDRAKAKKMLGSGLAIAALVILVAALLMLGSGGGNTGGGGKGDGINLLTDGTAPNAGDPELKDIGEGLLIRDIKIGEGDEVQPGARVTVHYTGWLTDGTIFDSSRRRGEPATFPLTGVIDGWKRGIPGMKPGGVRKLVVPGHLAYGPSGHGDSIPPNATLIFEVELLK